MKVYEDVQNKVKCFEVVLKSKQKTYDKCLEKYQILQRQQEELLVRLEQEVWNDRVGNLPFFTGFMKNWMKEVKELKVFSGRLKSRLKPNEEDSNNPVSYTKETNFGKEAVDLLRVVLARIDNIYK